MRSSCYWNTASLASPCDRHACRNRASVGTNFKPLPNDDSGVYGIVCDAEGNDNHYPFGDAVDKCMKHAIPIQLCADGIYTIVIYEANGITEDCKVKLSPTKVTGKQVPLKAKSVSPYQYLPH